MPILYVIICYHYSYHAFYNQKLRFLENDINECISILINYLRLEMPVTNIGLRKLTKNI